MIRLLTILSSRWTRLVLVLFVVLAIQTTLFAQLRPLGIAGQIVMLFVICSGINFGISIGALTGLIAGLMYDFVLTTPVGLNSLALGLIGVFGGLIVYFFQAPTWWMKLLAIVVVSIVGELISPIANLIVGQTDWLEPRVFTVAAIVAAINLVFGPIMIIVNRWALAEKKALV